MATIADINAECRSLCDADTSSYAAADLLRAINFALELVISWIIGADGTWQFDDSNYTDLPIGTQTLTDGQSVYSFNNKFLQIEEVKVKDINGVYRRLDPVDPSELSVSVEEWFGSTSGMPTHYDKVSDDTIKLYPSPSSTYVTLASGLKIHYKRTASLYTTAIVTTGTQEPGFLSPFHYILSYMAAIPYCMKYHPKRVALYERRVEQLKAGLIEAYSQKEKDKRKQMTMKRINFR